MNACKLTQRLPWPLLAKSILEVGTKVPQMTNYWSSVYYRTPTSVVCCDWTYKLGVTNNALKIYKI